MGVSLKLTRIGNSTGLVLPKEMLARLKVEQGDTIYLTETDGGYTMTPYNEEFAAQVEAGEGAMRKYRDVLRKLAK